MSGLAGQPLVLTPFCRRSWRTRSRLAPSAPASQAGLGRRSWCVLCRRGFARQVHAGSKGHQPQTARGGEHQAKHAMPPAVTGRVIGFHRFSIPSFRKDFCLQLSLVLQMGDGFTASLWSYCLLAEEWYGCQV